MRTPPPDRVVPHASRWPAGRLARLAVILLAIAYAIPVATAAYDRLMRVNQEARQNLIRDHRLWELQPDFRGRPELWARMASRLLDDRQLLARVATKYGGQSDLIELEYRRDLAIARAEVVLRASGIWAAPLVALYGVAWAIRRRKPVAPPKMPPPSASDPRYLPPGRE